ncbi:uncharacterized protein [Dermacentor albipictus]|uniref:uncharacterized protein n=1 Tax=Dermacentor albipictus TaxID=60249 RepID=UPI0031FC8B4D
MDESCPQSSTHWDEVLTLSSSSESIRRREPRHVFPGHSSRKARGSAAKSSQRRPSHSPKPETEDIASRSSAEAPGYVSTDESTLTPLTVAERSPWVKSSAPRKVHGTLQKANATPATHGEERSDVLEKGNVARSGSTAMTCGRGRRIYAEERETSKRSVFSRPGRRHHLARGRRTTSDSFAGRQASIPSSFEDIEGQRIFDADAAYPKSSLFGRLSTGIGSIARRLFRSGPPEALPTTVVRGKGKRTELGWLTSRSGEARTLRPESEGAPFGEEGRAQGFRLKRTRHSRRNDVYDTIQGSEQDLQPLYHATRSSHRHNRRSPIRRATETVVGGDGVPLSAACIAASDKARRVAPETSGVRRPVPEGQGDIQLQDHRGTCAMPKTRTTRFDPMVMIAAGENLRMKRKEESTRSHRRRHRSKERDERTRSKSPGSRGRGESNGEGEQRRKRKSRSRKRHRDGSRSRKEKSETNVAGSTYELSGSPSRSFDFSISPVPVTRGTLPRPELTRSSEVQLGSSTWLVDGHSSDSPQAVALDMKSSLRKPFAPSRKDEKREVNVISASSQLSNKKSKRSSKRSSKKKKTSRAEKEAEKEEPNQLPADGAVSPPSGQERGATSPQQMSEPRSKHKSKSKSKSKRKSREDKGSEAGKDGEKTPNDKEKRRKSKRKSKRTSREDKKSKADLSPGEESPKVAESRRGPGHRTHKGREGATSPGSPPSGEISPAESRSPSRPTSTAGPAGDVSPASPSGRISPAGLKSPSSETPTSQESSVSPESSRKKSRHHRHGKKHRRKKHKQRGSPRHKSRSRASKRSRSKHRRSKSSRSKKGKDRSPRSGEISSVTPESSVSGGSKRQERSGSRRSRSRSRSRSDRSGRSSHGSKRKSRSRKRHRDGSRSRKEKSETNVAESTYELSGSPSRFFDFSVSPVPVTRGTMPRPEISREDKKSKSRSRSRSGGSRRSSSKRSRESESISRSSPHRTTSDIRKHKGKKRHHRRRHRKGRGRSSHRKSRLHMTSGAGRGRKKRGDTVTESYAAQSAPPYLCLLLSGLGVVLAMVACGIMIYYVFTCRKQLMATTHSVFSGATQPEYPDPEHEPIAPEVVPGTAEAMQVYYCTTDHCKREARYIRRLLSQQERPCENFYKHVCNVWMSEHPAHALSTGSVVSRDTLLQDNIARRLVAVVGSARQRDIQVAANLYKACVNRGRSVATSKEAIGALFSRWKIEKWPRSTAVEDVMAVWTFAAELNRDLNLATLVRAGVGTDPDNVDVTAIELSQPRCLYARVGKDNKEAEDVLVAAVGEAATEIGDSGVAADALGGQMWSACTLIAAACRSGFGDDSVTVVKFGQLEHLGLQTFLTVLLDDGIGGADIVVLHSVRSFLRELQGALHAIPPLDTLNYLGFLAIVHVAPFLPDELRGLRYLFTEVRFGRTVGDAKDDTPLLCARLVERALPGCFAKAAQMWRLSNGQEMSTREWLTQLESVFLRHVADFPWMSQLSSLLIRYRVKRRALTQFGQSLGKRRDDACAPLDDQMGPGDPLLFFANVSRRRQAQKFRDLRGHSALLRRRAAGSEFSTEASFRRSLRVVHVPAALFNASVESNSSFFVFQLARVAVRFNRALVQLLHEDPYERDVPVSFTDDSRAKLDALLDCFDGDAQSSLGASSSTSPEALSQVRRAFLDGTSALLLAMKAFEELPPVKQIWKLDLRLAGLENSSARQLFFIYFALDNCESTAPAFHTSSMSAEDRVNVPLKHIEQFAEAFHCEAQDPMVSASDGSCSVMRGARHEQPTQRREYREPDGSSPSGV